MSEAAQTFAWIQSLLLGDATITGVSGFGGVWDTTAPDDTSRPFIIVQVMGGGDVTNASGGKRIKSDLLMMVKAVGESAQYGLLDTLASRFDVLLTPKPDGLNVFPITLSGVVILSCIRRMPHNLTYISADKLYTDLGGIYNVEAKI